MNKAYITGMTGTVAPYLKKELLRNGYEVIDKHIRINKDEDINTLKNYIEKENPDFIFHLALGPYNFATTLAKYCKDNNKTFVYISTVSVFEDNEGGPYTKDTIVTVTNDYGKYKYNCEKAVVEVNPESYIIRIGWQISDVGDATSNNMVQFIMSNLNEKKEIAVSDRFYPSTSFLNDTVSAIGYIVENQSPNLFLVNSNLDKSLYELILMVKKRFDLDIIVKRNSDFSRNDIMIDDRVNIRKL